jgi:hypothetical protein
VKTVYLMYEAIPLPVISSGGIMPLEDTAKAATATRSREIFLVVGNTGLFYPSCFAAPASSRRIHPPAFGLPPFGLKGRRFDGQAKRLIYAKLECPMQDIHL